MGPMLRSTPQRAVVIRAIAVHNTGRPVAEPFPKSLRSLSTLPLAVGSVIGRLTIAAAAPKGERGIERVAIKCICGVQKIMNGATIRRAVKRGIQSS